MSRSERCRRMRAARTIFCVSTAREADPGRRSGDSSPPGPPRACALPQPAPRCLAFCPRGGYLPRDSNGIVVNARISSRTGPSTSVYDTVASARSSDLHKTHTREVGEILLPGIRQTQSCCGHGTSPTISVPTGDLLFARPEPDRRGPDALRLHRHDVPRKKSTLCRGRLRKARERGRRMKHAACRSSRST